MTNHNLRDHLAWLLRNGPSTCLPLDYSVIPANEPPLGSVPTTSAEPITLSSSTGNPQVNAEAGDGPQNPAVFDMARLQLAPQSAKRARSLTQADRAPPSIPRPLPTPTPSRSSAHKPTIQQTQAPQSVSTPEIRPGRGQLRTPATGYQDSVFDDGPLLLDIDELDLTGDLDTSYEDLGEPKLLWTEGAATRPEPPANKRGKKRKSDEYTSDLVSPQSREGGQLRTRELRTVREGSAIRDQLARHNHVTVPPGLLRESESRSRKRPQGIDYEEELSITKTTVMTETRRSRSSAQVPQLQVPHSVNKTKGQGMPIKRVTPSYDRPTEAAASRASAKKIVPDSEDENEEHDVVKREGENSLLRNMDYGWDNDAEEAMVSPSPKKKTEARGSSCMKYQAVPSSSPVKPSVLLGSQSRTASKHRQDEKPVHVLSPSRQFSPSKAIAKATLTSSGTTSSGVAALSAQQNQQVQRCIKLPHADIQGYIALLEKRKKDNDHQVVAEMMEGNDERPPALQALQAKDRELKTKVRAMEELVRHKASCQVKLDRKENIKRRLTVLVSEGEFDIMNPQDEMSILSREVKKLNLELEECYIAMFDLLQQTGLLESGLLSSMASVDNLRSPQPFPAQVSPNLLIASTQHPVPRTLDQRAPQRLTPRDVPRVPLGQNPKFVQQGSNSLVNIGLINTLQSTQAKALESIPASPVAAIDQRPAHGEKGSRRHESLAIDPPDATIYFSPSRSPVRAKSKSYIAQPQPEDEYFSRRMGSPLSALPFEEDYDQIIGDDEEMLDVAEALEQDWAEAGADRSRIIHSRAALGETSGNSHRHPGLRLDSQLERAQSTLKQYPWSKDVMVAMKKRFHLQGFRTNQLEAINATLSGKDAFVLMPTGGGKSLCYQLPSIVQSGKTRGVTVVISPLLSLMQDQVEHLQKLKIQAFFINSEVTAEHRAFVLKALRGPNVEQLIELLYVTPEMLSKSQAINDVFQTLHKREKLARIVIDEAHCVSQWGHDFRPDYKALGEVRKQYQGVPVMALTATATENVKIDVIHNLGMDGCQVFSQSFNRPNLTYEVRAKGRASDAIISIADTIRTSYNGQSGIVYCLSRKNCEAIAKQLREEHKIKAMHYHAGMDPQEKSSVQKNWQSGMYDVIVATIAFGMGIDKPDVRFVIHHTIPKSLEGYYQETGRAGRDGKQSGCYLYYGYGDTTSLKRMIKDGEGSWEQKERQKQMLRNVVQFCENKSDCRRVQVLAYFNEHFSRDRCNNSCDNCKSGSTFETHDFTEHAKSMINLVRQLQKGRGDITLLYCVDVYRGSKVRKITDAGHHELEEHGLGSDLERGVIERLFHRLLSEDVLEEWHRVNKSGFANQYIKLGAKCRAYEEGRRQLKIQVRTSPDGKSKANPANKKARKNTGTGVRAAGAAFPASTNVSSPLVRGPAHRTATHSEDSDYHEEDLVDFEDVRVYGVPKLSKKPELGPPITIDEKIGTLDPHHRNVMDVFLDEAKELSRHIVMDKSLKQQPFSNTVLREMVINWAQSKEELLEIDGIDPQRVELYGTQFLKLVRKARNDYDAGMRVMKGLPDPEHRDVVDLTVQSSQEYSDVSFSDAETSPHFGQRDKDSEVNIFNAQGISPWPGHEFNETKLTVTQRYKYRPYQKSLQNMPLKILLVDGVGWYLVVTVAVKVAREVHEGRSLAVASPGEDLPVRASRKREYLALGRGTKAKPVAMFSRPGEAVGRRGRAGEEESG